MKFNFKIQPYQTSAVESVVNVFSGQRYWERVGYIRDLGKMEVNSRQLPVKIEDEYGEGVDLQDDTGFRNEVVGLTDEQLLENIHEQQRLNNIKLSTSLVKDFGRCVLDVEMETGTGKTYVYIKTMFELNKLYGWSKFIVVVPSVAIREGVKKSFEITQDHFMEHYHKKARFFVYNSSNLEQLDTFSASGEINVMIINTQAFASSLKEGGKSKESLIIYSKRDDFCSRRPIDVIRANRPILIMDEPQKMGGEVTRKALKHFNPLFSLNYSATHSKHNNLVYVLDALDAYNKKLVKKIEVKGFEVKNLRGADRYLCFENIVVSSKKPPMARMEIEVKRKNGIRREMHIVSVGDDLYHISREMEQYRGYMVSEIDRNRETITFANGEVIVRGSVVGDVSERDMRRIQIRETILSHFEKEEKLFNMGIKTLSLFFIDEVAKYRVYDENGDEGLGEYGEIFEQEYNSVLADYLTSSSTPYQDYLKRYDVKTLHKGYFSIDKITGRSVDSSLKRGSEFSDDISAYDLILKNKERLLSFEEPTRFIFSHSALREGWDNPNVFQICTLKHSDSTTMKRQEVGRGLRLCVDQSGNRMDEETCGGDIHKINLLTVIASESYRNFVDDLQKQIKEVLYDRPTKATAEYFMNKTVLAGEDRVVINAKQANAIWKYLIRNSYIDDEDSVADKYREDLTNGCLAELPEELQPMTEGIHRLIQGIFDERVLEEMIDDGNTTKIADNGLNDNFFKKEFQALWGYINNKYSYTVDFSSEELIDKAVEHIRNKLFVSELQYTRMTGKQHDKISEYDLDKGTSFETVKTKTEVLRLSETSNVKYDLIGQIAKGATLTRKTAAAILQQAGPDCLSMFKNNPEEFIAKVITLIKEQKATMIVDHISYNRIDGKYDNQIFTAGQGVQSRAKAFRAEKHIQDYVFTDGIAEQSVERRFAEDLDADQDVCVYAKLPKKGFAIPTPLGSYSPDWAIAFNEGSVKHIYFVAETKGSMNSLELREIEKGKTDCARKLFDELSGGKVKYGVVSSYEDLLNMIKGSNNCKAGANY